MISASLFDYYVLSIAYRLEAGYYYYKSAI